MYKLGNMGLKIFITLASGCVFSHISFCARVRLQKKCLRLSRSRDENLIACLSNFFIRKFPSDGWKRKKKFRLDNFFLLQEKVSFLLCLPPNAAQLFILLQPFVKKSLTESPNNESQLPGRQWGIITCQVTAPLPEEKLDRSTVV